MIDWDVEKRPDRLCSQEMFLRAVQQKAMDPMAWAKVPKLLSIAQDYVLTDMNTAQLMQIVTFARSVPKDNQQMFMLPGNFSGTGDWAANDTEVQIVVARLMGQPVSTSTKDSIRVTVENATSDPESGRKLYRYLSGCGYNVVAFKAKSDVYGAPLQTTRIIAQKGNTDEALLIKRDLDNHGDIVNASVGDIQSSITVIAGDDVSALGQSTEQAVHTTRRRTTRRQ